MCYILLSLFLKISCVNLYLFSYFWVDIDTQAVWLNMSALLYTYVPAGWIFMEAKNKPTLY